MFRQLLVFVAVLGAAQALAAGETILTDLPRAPAPSRAALQQELLARQFREFEQQLLSLAQRLDKSNKPEDRERAKTLRTAIRIASEKALDVRFDKLVELLKKSDLSTFE